jgi:hypothetical protein
MRRVGQQGVERLPHLICGVGCFSVILFPFTLRTTFAAYPNFHCRIYLSNTTISISLCHDFSRLHSIQHNEKYIACKCHVLFLLANSTSDIIKQDFALLSHQYFLIRYSKGQPNRLYLYLESIEIVLKLSLYSCFAHFFKTYPLFLQF